MRRNLRVETATQDDLDPLRNFNFTDESQAVLDLADLSQQERRRLASCLGRVIFSNAGRNRGMGALALAVQLSKDKALFTFHDMRCAMLNF